MNDFFNKCDLLQGIPTELLEELVAENGLYIRSYNKNKTVHEEGLGCNTLDIVLEGKLIAYSLTKKGSENVVFDFQRGSIIGANLLYGNNNFYPMNIYCTENSKLLHIEKAAVTQLLKNHNFSMSFIKSLSNNSQGMNRKIAIYSQNSLQENILNYFTTLSIEQNSNSIYLPITKKQLADYLGVQRPSLFRELKKMTELKLIKIDNRNITIL